MPPHAQQACCRAPGCLHTSLRAKSPYSATYCDTRHRPTTLRSSPGASGPTHCRRRSGRRRQRSSLFPGGENPFGYWRSWRGLTAARLLTRAPGSAEGGLVLGEHSRIPNLDARRKRQAFLEAAIYTNLSVLSVRSRLVFNRKIAIPTSASLPRKRSGCDPSLNFPVLPKTNFASVKPHDRPLRS
jgi:hypothetical protein